MKGRRRDRNSLWGRYEEVISDESETFKMLKDSKECVINIPTREIDLPSVIQTK